MCSWIEPVTPLPFLVEAVGGPAVGPPSLAPPSIMSTIVHSLRDYRPPTRAQQFAFAFGLPPIEGPYLEES